MIECEFANGFEAEELFSVLPNDVSMEGLVEKNVQNLNSSATPENLMRKRQRRTKRRGYLPASKRYEKSPNSSTDSTEPEQPDAELHFTQDLADLDSSPVYHNNVRIFWFSKH